MGYLIYPPLCNIALLAVIFLQWNLDITNLYCNDLGIKNNFLYPSNRKLY